MRVKREEDLGTKYLHHDELFIPGLLTDIGPMLAETQPNGVLRGVSSSSLYEVNEL